jgi:formylglycine-generating enzyme required for sulfatase activity
VYAAFVDTSVRFMGDKIDPGLWHVLHARHTPPQVLADAFEQRVTIESFPDAPRPPRGETSAAVVDSASVRLTNSLGMWFVRVSAGEFRMGVPDQGNDFEPPPESPAHTVRITRDYWLGDREVTRGQYVQVMGLALPDDAPATQPEHVQDVLPMTEVTWEQAVEFCRRLGALPEELTAGRTYRLPTEAEWEFACRARTSAPYHWRSKRQPGDVSGEAAGIDPPLPLRAVGSYPPNALGLYDLRGNAWEWCADWFDRDYYLRSPVDDPQGPGHGYLKVVRGGDWRYVGEPCRHDYAMLPPWLGNPVTGFRVVCERGMSQPIDRPAPPPVVQR